MDFQPIQGPHVGFRVEVHDPGHKCNNDTFRGGDGGGMLSRDPDRPLDATAFREHLEGAPEGGPLISFTRSWACAMQCRDDYIKKEKAQDVVVIAVWLKGLTLYDASEVASSEHVDLNPDQKVRLLNEVLLYKSVLEKERRILATLYGTQEAEMVQLSLPRFTSPYLELSDLPWVPAERPTQLHLPIFKSSISVPPKPAGPHPPIAERLGLEMYHHTGILDAAKYIHLALSMCGQEYTIVQNGKFKLHFP